MVRKALYGRLSAGRCITDEYAHTMNCFSDLSIYLENLCSGKESCHLLVANVDSIAQPCPKDFNSYLEVTYECVKGTFIIDLKH